MRSVIRIAMLLLALQLFWPASEARAEGFFSPWYGVNFGSEEADGESAYGFDAGFMGDGIAGIELDFGYAPEYFGEEVDNYVMTGMVNLILGAPIGGESGPGVRPYFVGGLGLIRTNFEFEPEDVSNNDLGFDIGGGIMGFFSDHVGARGDVRYFRNFSELDLGDADAGDFDFWRATVSVVFR